MAIFSQSESSTELQTPMESLSQPDQEPESASEEKKSSRNEDLGISGTAPPPTARNDVQDGE